LNYRCLLSKDRINIVTLLNALGSPLSNDDVVTYAINGLSDKFVHVVGIIAHHDPFPDLSYDSFHGYDGRDAPQLQASNNFYQVTRPPRLLRCF
jgi:hypothetical protein